MSGFSFSIIAFTIFSASAFAGENQQLSSEQISVRQNLATHLGLNQDQEVVFGTPREFRSPALDSTPEIEPMDEKAAEEADHRTISGKRKGI
jgi:hypothetical protein